MSISVEKLHSQIHLRILSCSRMSENHREPEVPEEKVPVVECLDGFARITSKELAITHFVKNGTLQNACSTRPRVVVEEGVSSCLSSSVSHDRTGRPVVCSTFDSQVSSVQETQRHSSESEQIRILLERQREQILADCQAEIQKHEFQADDDRRSIQKIEWSHRVSTR